MTGHYPRTVVTPPPPPPSAADDAEHRARTADALQRALGSLSTAATQRMESDVAWFRDLSAEDRSWVGFVIQAGIRSFVEWWRHGGEDQPADTLIAGTVFGAAPRALAGVITLQQTVDLVRLAIDVVEANVEPLLEPVDRAAVHAGVLHYGRELAFATARVYARAAELRGAWDARLEALVVDSVVRGDADAEVLSRASALGWGQGRGVCVVVGDVATSRPAPDLVGEVRRRALARVSDVLCAIQGHRLVVVLGGVGREGRQRTDDDGGEPGVLDAAASVLDQFDDGAVVVGPWVEDLAAAHVSAREAVAAHAVAVAWPDAPRPVHALDLLPERLLAGERGAGAQLLDHVHRPLAEHRSALVETLTAFFAQRSSIEATARALFVHPNTVRYRLAQVAEVTGCTPTDPRDGFTLQIALALGRQGAREGTREEQAPREEHGPTSA